jgi:hypothetical protein
MFWQHSFKISAKEKRNYLQMIHIWLKLVLETGTKTYAGMGNGLPDEYMHFVLAM